ncbi:MAG: dihydrolipoyl dehydrogenase [Halobacteriales archaeon]
MAAGDSTETDVLVIGGGPGGYAAAIRAGQLGLDVALVEMDAYGGACLNRGCIPSKALLSATRLAHEAGAAAEMGVHADPEVDAGEMTDWKDGVVDRLTSGVEKLCLGNGVDLIEGRAAFVGDHRARVHGEDGSERATIDFGYAIVATGSRPIEVPGFPFDADPVLDSDAALSVDEAPDSLAVIGAGYVGMELSTVFARMGTDVTVIEALDAALPAYPDDLTQPVRERLADLGVTFRFGEAASEWRETGERTGDDGRIVVETETEDGETREYPAESVLVAVGREPVTGTLNLDAVGLEPTDAGFLETDEQARTDREHVFAVGDVAGEPMLAHKASAEGEVAAETSAAEIGDGSSAAEIGGGSDPDERPSLESRAIPAAVFTDPEIGTVGLTEEEASGAGFDPVVGEFPLRASGRALTLGETDGFVRIVGDADSGVVLGGQAVAPEASELIAEVGLAVETGATLADVAGTVHTHPTLSESTMGAAKNALEAAIHTLNR